LTSPINKTVALMLTGLILYGSLLTAAMAAPQKPKSGKQPPSGQIAAGKKVYDSNKCASCHIINGKGGKSGPDLSNEGANAKHTSKWLEEEIKDPKSHKANSVMPSYKDKVKGKDLSNLVAYLRSLKKR
jgi:mono/diheme cytochrome c family protein